MCSLCNIISPYYGLSTCALLRFYGYSYYDNSILYRGKNRVNHHDNNSVFLLQTYYRYVDNLWQYDAMRIYFTILHRLNPLKKIKIIINDYQEGFYFNITPPS